MALFILEKHLKTYSLYYLLCYYNGYRGVLLTKEAVTKMLIDNGRVEIEEINDSGH